MRRHSGSCRIALLGAVTLVLFVGFGARPEQALSEPEQIAPEPQAGGAAFAPGEILVKLEESAPADAIQPINRSNDAQVEEKLPHLRVSVIDLPQDLSVGEAIDRYEASPAVAYAEPNYKLTAAVNAPTPNDPSFPKMYDLYNRGQNGGSFDADIDAPEAWNLTTGSDSTVVAVIDTGMDINHRDLRDNIWTNPGEIPGNCVDDDNNDYVDDVHGWDFRDSKEDREDHDGNCAFTPGDNGEDNSVFDGVGQDTHATHVAGTIAAAGNNDVGVTGVNWQATIMPLKFIGPGNIGYVDDAAEAIDYSIAEGVEISNNSYGYYDSCGGCFARTLRDAIGRADAAGHLFVGAAMNGGADYVGDDNDVTSVYPASYDIPTIISVAASNNEDELASFSNYGATSVDLAAPGKGILSTLPGNAYGYGEGTSMATPHVAGVAALIKSQFPQLNAEEIKARILASVDKKASLEGKLVTGGRLNAAKALGADTAPVVVGSHFRPRMRDQTPIMRMTVRDDETELTKDQIGVYLDGRQKWGFSYDPVNDMLIYKTRKLAPRRHSIQVVVQDGQGLEEISTWKFRVIRRR